MSDRTPAQMARLRGFFMPPAPISSHFFPPICTIGTAKAASQKNLGSFPFCDSDLGCISSPGQRSAEIGLTQINRLGKLLDVEAHTHAAAAQKAAFAARRHTARRFAQRKRTRVAGVGRIEMNQGTDASARESQNNPCSVDTFCIHRRASEARLTLIVKKREKESADKPGSVEDNHSSAIRVTAYLQRPTREPVWATRAAPSEDGTACSPIWSCSRRGLPCHRVLPPAR